MRSLKTALATVAVLGAVAAPAAAAPRHLIPIPHALPVGIDGARDGVHPGAVLETRIGFCTMNFLFEDPAGNRYIGSAGHCVLEGPEIGSVDIGQKTWAPGTGPLAKDADGTVVGRFVYAIRKDSAARDFSLIRLNPAGVEESSPAMPHFGGPTGIDTDTGHTPIQLDFFGNGVVLGDLLPARSLLALFGEPDPDEVLAFGLSAPGDSGSAVERADGKATGVLVAFGVGLQGDVISTRIAPQIGLAEQALGTTLTLQTAPLNAALQ